MTEKNYLDLQKFASPRSAKATYDGSVVKGSRLFVSVAVVPTLADEIAGVRQTPDKGGDQEKVESTCIADIVQKDVIGLLGSSDIEYTFGLSKETLENQLSLISGDKWVYEEIEDTSGDETKIGMGILLKVKFGSIKPSGQQSNNLREFTQSGTMISDGYYLAIPTYATESATPTWKYTNMISGAVVTEPK